VHAALRRIEERGPIPFADYMRLALYDPDGGFYARRAPGASGSAGAGYRTSPSLTPWFGRLVARDLQRRWGALGRPDPFTVVEVGAGRGDFAAAAIPAFDGPLRWQIVEPFAAVAALQRERLGPLATTVTWRPALTAGKAVVGCVLANEVLDNQPVHVLEKTPTGVAEVHVALDGGEPVEVLLPVSDSRLDRRAAPALPHLGEGDRFEVGLAAEAWVAEAAGALERGWLVAIDYGDEEPALWQGRPGGTIVTYRGETLGVDPLSAPGEADITAHVDFTALARAASAAGLEPEPLLTQREWLADLGAGDDANELRRRQDEAQAGGDHAAMVQLLAERSRLVALTARGGLGDLRVFRASKGLRNHS